MTTPYRGAFQPTRRSILLEVLLPTFESAQHCARGTEVRDESTHRVVPLRRCLAPAPSCVARRCAPAKGGRTPTEPPEASSCCQKGQQRRWHFREPTHRVNQWRSLRSEFGGWVAGRMSFRPPRAAKAGALDYPETKGGALGGLTGESLFEVGGRGYS